jgi:hypothetical protein
MGKVNPRSPRRPALIRRVYEIDPAVRRRILR